MEKINLKIGSWYRIVFTPYFQKQLSTLQFNPLNTVIAKFTYFNDSYHYNEYSQFQHFKTKEGNTLIFIGGLGLNKNEHIIEEVEEPKEMKKREFELLENYGGKVIGDIIYITSTHATGTSWKYKGSTIRLDIDNAIKEGLIKAKEELKKVLFRTNEDEYFIDGPVSKDIYDGDIVYYIGTSGQTTGTFIANKNLNYNSTTKTFKTESSAKQVVSLLLEIEKQKLSIGQAGLFNRIQGFYVKDHAGIRSVNGIFYDTDNKYFIESFKIYQNNLQLTIVTANPANPIRFLFPLYKLVKKLTFGGIEIEKKKYFIRIQEREWVHIDKVKELYNSISFLQSEFFSGYVIKTLNTENKTFDPREVTSVTIGCITGTLKEVEDILKHFGKI